MLNIKLTIQDHTQSVDVVVTDMDELWLRLKTAIHVPEVDLIKPYWRFWSGSTRITETAQLVDNMELKCNKIGHIRRYAVHILVGGAVVLLGAAAYWYHRQVEDLRATVRKSDLELTQLRGQHKQFLESETLIELAAWATCGFAANITDIQKEREARLSRLNGLITREALLKIYNSHKSVRFIDECKRQFGLV